jgi:hypothetical protein
MDGRAVTTRVGTASTYRLRYVALVEVLTMIMTWVIGVWLLIAAISHGGLGASLFVCGCMVFLSAGSAHYARRVPYRWQLRDDVLLWRSLLKSGHIPLSSVASIAPGFGGRHPASLYICKRDGRRYQLLLQKGVVDFIEEMSRRAPWINVTLPEVVGIVRRTPGPSSHTGGRPGGARESGPGG